MRTNYAPFREPRYVTSEEVAESRARWYADQDIAHWREKRRKAHKLLKAARREIQRLRALVREH